MANDPLNQTASGETIPPHPHKAAEPRSADSRWQRRLLPFLVGTLGVLTVLFCAAIALETHYIQSRMESPLQLDLRTAVNQQFSTNPNFLLESNLIERRYRTADAAALSRIYLMFLGFGTGMVMALVGATFILGKISEPATSIDGSGSSFKASLHSGSPGVILAVLGTVLMLSTIFSKTEISLTDRAVYMGTTADTSALPQADAEPATPENSKTPDREPPAAQNQPADMEKSGSGTPVLDAKNEPQRPDLHITMASHPTLDGDYRLTVDRNPCTLSIRGNAVQLTASDGNKMNVRVTAINRSHVTFAVIDTAGGRRTFDGLLSDDGNIAGSTSYQGGFSTNPAGFTAIRINHK